jgi:hypothetical protein
MAGLVFIVEWSTSFAALKQDSRAPRRGHLGPVGTDESSLAIHRQETGDQRNQVS